MQLKSVLEYLWPPPESPIEVCPLFSSKIVLFYEIGLQAVVLVYFGANFEIGRAHV